MKHARQSPAAEPEQTQGHTDVVHRLEQIGRAVLRDGELAAILGLGLSRFYLRKKRGEFRALELEQVGSSNTRYSGPLVAEWIRTGDLPRRFFKTAPRVTRRGRKAGTAPGVSQRRLTIAQSSR